ncbi:MAG TPA: hypothetical protein VJS45_00945 [Acidimicrobiia bacterium]|nr:hypothetical protein [Acidimicrobiia bacterium]
MEGPLETVGDGGVEFGEKVPVAVERDLDAAVPEAGLDGLRMGALSDGQRHRGVAEIVEPETVQAGLELGRLPVGCVEARRGDGLARPVREDEPGRAEERSVSELLDEHVGQEPGDRHTTSPGSGLWRLPEELALHLDELLEDGDRPAGDVDPAPLESDQLAPTQPGIGRRIDEHPEVRMHVLGQPVDLGGGEEAHLDRLDGRRLDPGARRLHQEVGLHRHPQQPAEGAEVAVDRRGRDAGGELVRQPGADIERPDTAQRQMPEVGEDVPGEVALVGGQRRRPEIRNRGEVSSGPLGQREAPGGRIDPLTSLHVGAGGVEEPPGLELGVEGPATAPPARVPVAGPPAPLRCSTDGAHASPTQSVMASTLSGPPIPTPQRLLGNGCRARLFQPLLDLDGIEPEQVPPLEERDPPLEYEPADVAFIDVELLRHLLEGEQPSPMAGADGMSLVVDQPDLLGRHRRPTRSGVSR